MKGRARVLFSCNACLLRRNCALIRLFNFVLCDKIFRRRPRSRIKIKSISSVFVAFKTENIYTDLAKLLIAAFRVQSRF